MTIDTVQSVVTPVATQDNGLQLALFSDGALAYSASFDGGSQKAGFAGRITVNAAVIQDSDLLVNYSTSPPTGGGDPARPLELLQRFNDTAFTFAPGTGIGSANVPLSTTVSEFAQRIVNFQGQQAEIGLATQDAQAIVVGALNDRFLDDTGVSVDNELARLTELQNAYAANARVMSVVQELMDILIRI